VQLDTHRMLLAVQLDTHKMLLAVQLDTHVNVPFVGGAELSLQRELLQHFLLATQS